VLVLMTEPGHQPSDRDLTQFRLLGTLAVSHDGTEIPITSGKQRAVLAALLVNANLSIAADDIIELVWTRPPPSARVTLQNYIKRLRHVLPAADRPRLLTNPNGYLLRVAAHELDLATFSDECAAGHAAAAAGDWERASSHFASGLVLWRGTPFADIPSDTLAGAERRRLEETRWQALEAKLHADMRLGRHAQVVAEARYLVAFEPFRERLQESLMLALYGNGQRAEALAVYRQVHYQLATEIGIEPGPALQSLHQQILRDDPTLRALAELPDRRQDAPALPPAADTWPALIGCG
jgi:DNA-binding SARP family transcriptional activator